MVDFINQQIQIFYFLKVMTDDIFFHLFSSLPWGFNFFFQMLFTGGRESMFVGGGLGEGERDGFGWFTFQMPEPGQANSGSSQLNPGLSRE